jgi:hypothetical protein
MNSWSVGPYSTISPMYMYAVKSETRAACCMLWVTIATVYSDFNSCTSSSILAVEIGSSAEVGSSSRMTEGFTATDLAMHSRCCWPPDSASPLWFSLSLASFHSAVLVNAHSTRSSISPLDSFS